MAAASLSTIRFLSDPSYRISGLIGVLTYGAYASLNNAWLNPVLVLVALYMYLCTPWFSKVSNQIETETAERTGLVTVGRISRYLVQLAFNLALVWVFLAGRILDSSGLEGIGGVFAAAAWITAVSQGGQYLACWLGHKGIGCPDRNVVVALATSVVVIALAVSGLTWIQPIFVTVSLALGITIFGVGIVLDARSVLRKAVCTTTEYRSGVR